jgi:hypothetical protein
MRLRTGSLVAAGGHSAAPPGLRPASQADSHSPRLTTWWLAAASMTEFRSSRRASADTRPASRLRVAENSCRGSALDTKTGGQPKLSAVLVGWVTLQSRGISTSPSTHELANESSLKPSEDSMSIAGSEPSRRGRNGPRPIGGASVRRWHWPRPTHLRPLPNSFTAGRSLLRIAVQLQYCSAIDLLGRSAKRRVSLPWASRSSRGTGDGNHHVRLARSAAP